MTPKSFVYLAGATAVSAVLAFVSFAATNQWSTAPKGGARLMPKLERSIGDVAEVSIAQGGETVVLQRVGGSWSLKSRDGYPVDTAKVRTLLVGLGQAELVEAKTNRPDKYAVLELEDPGKAGSKSRMVTLTDGKGGIVAQAVIGKKRAEGGYGLGKVAGTYVRVPDNPQTWLANAEIDTPVGTKDWAKTSVLALEADKINRIGVEIPGEQPLKIERPAPPAAKDAKSDGKDAAKDASKAPTPPAPPAATPGKLAFVGFPSDGKKLKDPYAAEALTRAVTAIDLEDVRKLAAPPADGASLVKIERADGLAATLRLRKDGDAYWLSVTATGSEGDAKKAAEEIADRTKDWEFKIPAFKADLILKKRADLIEASGS